jgi:hypothetical protein
MMETIKRHLFLVALGGGVAVVTLAIALVTYFAYMAPNDKLGRSYANTKGLAEKIQQSPIFTAELVDALAKQTELRKGQYANLLAAIRKEGAARKPLVPGVFPTTTDSGKRLNFKNKYDAELRRFAKDILHAVTAPGVVEKDAVRSEEEGLMYIHPKMSFARPEWVDRPDAPSIDKVREGQENLWLMEDVVGIIAKMNEELRPKDQRPTMANSPIKEIVEIKIGSDLAVLAGSKMSGGMGRYVSASPAARKADDKGDKKDAKDKEAKEPEKAEAVPRASTLSGRWSAPGFHEVLPFKLVVVIESRYSGELIRRLKGTESFIGVGAFRLKPVSESAKELMGSRRDYGAQAIDRLEVAAESLVFQLEGGRVTTVPAKPVAPAAATKAK